MAKKDMELKLIPYPPPEDLDIWECGDIFLEKQKGINLIREIKKLFQNFMYPIGNVIVPPLESKLRSNSKSRRILEKIFTKYYDDKLFESALLDKVQIHETPKIDEDDNDPTCGAGFWKAPIEK